MDSENRSRKVNPVPAVYRKVGKSGLLFSLAISVSLSAQVATGTVQGDELGSRLGQVKEFRRRESLWARMEPRLAIAGGVSMPMSVLGPVLEPTSGFQAAFDMRLPYDWKIEIRPGLWWASSAYRSKVSDFKADLTSMTIGSYVDVVYPVRSPKLRPYAGMGAGVTFLSLQKSFVPVINSSAADFSATGVDPTFAFRLGVARRISVIDIYIESQYTIWLESITGHLLDSRLGVAYLF